MLSHELRSPLNSIFGWAQLLRQRFDGLRSVAQGLESIERNAREQARLIDDLLDVSRVVSGKVHIDRQALDLVSAIMRRLIPYGLQHKRR